MRTLNLGILAHVDAGKTSLTERLLHAAGVIDEVGSVDDGSTQTDTLALERRRGITIKSAVVSFAIADTTVNLIDTPGHPDFIAEVERVLSVLDGAVLVVSGVEGVQAQTRVLMRALVRLGIPTLFFVNKLDRREADAERTLRAIAEKLTPAAAPPERMADVLTANDDALLAAYVDGTLTAERRREALADQTARGLAHPVFFGSAITGDGVAELTRGLRELLPASGGDPEDPTSGTVFKIERGAAYVRMHGGTLRVRDRLPDGRKVTALRVFGDEDAGGGRGRAHRPRVGAGGHPHRRRHRHAAPGARRAVRTPTLETVVEPVHPEDRGRLHVALERLAEQDPLIDLRDGEIVSLYGEVQKEVIQATLADDFGVEAAFRETTTIYVERPAGTGEAVEIIDEGGNPFLATVGLRVEPAPHGTGLRYGLEVELGSMPSAFMKAVEQSVAEALGEGVYGWRVLDCRVTLTHSGYWARQSHSHATFDKSMSSTARDFRGLTPLVLRAALERAGTTVFEPLHAFRLELPEDTVGVVLPALARLRGVAQPAAAPGVLEGELPAARVHELRRRLPGLTRGEGFLETEFARYRPVSGRPPRRAC